MNTHKWLTAAAAIVLAVCAVPTAEAAQTRELVLHSFGNRGDGRAPGAALIDVNGILYGTTEKGDTGNCTGGCGTVYSLDPSTGSETVLYSFCSLRNCADGAYPYASLINVNGIFFGTTKSGGTIDRGTVYSLDPKTGVEAVLYSFCGQADCADGADPLGSLVDVNGTLYGATPNGGAQSWGTVFSVDPSTGAEAVLHSFGSGTDGKQPVSGLVDLDGTLYGTTYYGGNGDSNCPIDGCGTVFSVDPGTGAEQVVYFFCSQKYCSDGSNADAGLITVNGTLYGATYYGGSGSEGTVFSLDPNTSAETVIYSFPGGTTGGYVSQELIDVKGILYGTTPVGGTGNCYCGTVFSLDPNTGVETVIHSFACRTDGHDPASSLTNENGLLYGTTRKGGIYHRGTVFAVKR